MRMFSAIWHWLLTISPRMWYGVGVVSFVFFMGSLLALPWIVARLPVNYFRHDTDPQPLRTFRDWTRAILKNLVGAILLVMGIAMLVLPGQGVLTILIGLSLLDFPGRRACQHRLLTRPQIFAALNWLRTHRHQPPFLPSNSPQPPSETRKD